MYGCLPTKNHPQGSCVTAAAATQQLPARTLLWGAVCLLLLTKWSSRNTWTLSLRQICFSSSQVTMNCSPGCILTKCVWSCDLLQ